MRRIVIDASSALKWHLVEEEHRQKALDNISKDKSPSHGSTGTNMGLIES